MNTKTNPMTLSLYIIAVALIVIAATTLKKKHEENKLLKLEIERTHLEIQILKTQSNATSNQTL